MPFNPMPQKTLQLFAGGHTDLDPYLKTAFGAGNCPCAGQVQISYDRLKNPIQFDRGLSHLSPTGGRETFDFGGHQQALVNQQLIDFINANGVGSNIEIITLPACSVVTMLAVSIYMMDPGLSLKLTTRNSSVLPTTGKKITVPAGATCDSAFTEASAASSVLNTITAPASSSASEHFVFTGGATLNANSDVISLQVVAMPTDGVFTRNNFIQVDVGYEVPVRIYR